MIHVRIDDEPENSKRRFACGIGPDLPPGDAYFFAAESAAGTADCPGCNPGGPRQFGTPISELSGQQGQAGYAEFCRIAETWGYQ